MIKSFEPGLISVIMPCFNAEPYLREAVDSVLNQTYPSVELTVVDDGSTDGSVDILQRLATQYSPRLNLLHQDRLGPYPARNLGLQHAQGEFVAFLDADDWWSLDCLEKLRSALVNSNAVLAYCGWQNVGAVDRSNDPYVPPDYEKGDKAEQFLRAAAPWPIHAVLTRREAITALRGFDTRWPTCMDYDLWLRIAVANHIVLVPEVMAFYRHKVSGQITSKQWVQAENSWQVKQKFVHNYPELVAHLGSGKLRQLIDGGFLKRGYQAYWRRDLVTSRHVFRKVLRHGGWKLPDLKYLLPALLPERAYVKLVQTLSGR
ncbi:glycosyl transferase family 2 [Sulfuricella sp. T08]|uniref:glycosyltransferase n=1 Tax=Sulfuricella sp. T08 TaxID=1632857 RepID=UPI00061796A8|nr:glycosyltransferase [Sulfuricella sp. T08]GAO34878.1 glycosyl transferase family 2 [Sulfuricella sp. T08]